MDIQFGLSKTERDDVAESLSNFLANTYALYLKTQNFHFNVTGPEFFSLHLLFEKQYKELSEAVDEIAERIRTLGFFVDASFSGFKKRMTIPEVTQMISAKKMLEELVAGHEIVIREARPLITRFQGLHDEASADLVIKRLGVHEKESWMLRSHLTAS